MAPFSKSKAYLGGFVLGVGFIIAAHEFGNYALQNYSCNAASYFGAKTPISCVWYQFAYGSKTWLEIIGWLLIGINGLIVLLELHENSAESAQRKDQLSAQRTPSDKTT